MAAFAEEVDRVGDESFEAVFLVDLAEDAHIPDTDQDAADPSQNEYSDCTLRD